MSATSQGSSIGLTVGLGGIGLGGQTNPTNTNNEPTSTQIAADNILLKEIKQNQILGQWMTWCQTCKHGGHAHCISEWF